MALAPVLSPHGVLSLKPSDEPTALESAHVARLEQAFARGSGHGLLYLGADRIGTTLPPTLAYWREIATRFITALCALPGLDAALRKPHVPAPGEDDLGRWVAAVPPMIGAEYLTVAVLADLWRGVDSAFDAELAEAGLSVQAFLKARHP
ncbi:MAG TPA: ATP-dependent helicase, partial [Vineibacter sp.]|nr:ATP-dependent helicase [Vineibacter sp.]